MAPKKRSKTTAKKRVTDTLASSAEVRKSILTAGALDDLRFLEPIRTRNRVISCFEEIFYRVERLERLHRDKEQG